MGNQKRTRVQKAGFVVVPKKTKEQKIKQAYEDLAKRRERKWMISQSDGHKTKKSEKMDDKKMAKRTVSPKKKTTAKQPDFKIRKFPSSKSSRELRKHQSELRERTKKLSI